ncbi:hypothetical protein [Nonomuraea jabiensis]|uniref:Uncharacterized protein n=1 Tax=Nonomuraea jabiensis TaxID=882448 RepID=A0A7W9L8Z2_9ACTN|nr:hypothetical protein [Nonomuraea jabiensis]MBB5775030.1 hypothetical protein [Nonomuraea jabiensis]
MTRGKLDDREPRTAMHRWACNTKQREEAPEEAATARWIANNTKPVSALTYDPGLALELLDAATSLLDGRRVAPNTVRKHRMLPYNALDYAVELKLPPANPLKTLKWKPPASAYEVDWRRVVNHAQARRCSPP